MRGRTLARRAVALAVVVWAGIAAETPVRAETPASPAPCDKVAAARTMAELGPLLEDQARRSHNWNVAWGVTYGLTAAAQFTFAAKPEWAPIDVDEDMQKGLYVGAVKSAIGALSRVVVPLRASQPDREVSEPCAGAAAAEASLRITAKKQRNSFWLNHLGGLAVNLSGALVLGLAYDSWSTAITSFAVGYPVGLLSTYTMPRGGWSEQRRRDGLTVTVAPLPNGIAIVGTF